MKKFSSIPRSFVLTITLISVSSLFLKAQDYRLTFSGTGSGSTVSNDGTDIPYSTNDYAWSKLRDPSSNCI